jgi:AraC-like DNA-binding protein
MSSELRCDSPQRAIASCFLPTSWKNPRGSAPLVTDQLTKLAAALAAQLTPVASLQDRVARTARALLADGVRPHRAVVARRLGMSQRSLQRGLEAEGTTFRAVHESVLWELVEALLSNPALKLDTVARSVGFGDLAAFSKAFRRWTGCTPARYRAQLGIP